MIASRKSLAAGVLVLLAALLLPWGARRFSSTPREEIDAVAATVRTATARPPTKLLAADPGLPAPQLSPHPTGSAEDRAWLKDRGEAIIDLSWNDDAESLNAILTELSNPAPEIRASALTATLNFGSRDAIPRLQAVALGTKDALEKKNLEEAAEHLKLPSLTEVLAGKKQAAGK